MNRARRGWGANPPDWIVALARACDQSSQADVARQLGYKNGSIVNQVLGRTNQAVRLDRVEARVRGQFMKATVSCPVLGEISTRDCQDNQLRNRNFRATNPLRVALRAACPKCPNREKECSS